MNLHGRLDLAQRDLQLVCQFRILPPAEQIHTLPDNDLRAISGTASSFTQHIQLHQQRLLRDARTNPHRFCPLDDALNNFPRGC